MPVITILIIDPDAASRTFIANVLKQRQYLALPVASGKEGLILAWRDRPDLIIVEPSLPDLSGEELAQKLRQDPRTAHVPLLALSADDRASRLRACLQAGYREYLVKSPVVTAELVEAVDRLLGQETASHAARQQALSMVFLSAKGGIGTSSLCANLAMNIGMLNLDSPVALADLVLPIGSIASIVGAEAAQNVVAAAQRIAADPQAQLELTDLPIWHFHLLAGSPDPESASQLPADAIPAILERIQRTYRFMVLDIGRSLSRVTLPIIQGADLVVLVVSPDLSSITLTRTVLAYLHSKGVESRSIYTILNRAVGLEGLSRPEAEKALGLPIQSGIPYLPYFSLANNLHQPFALKFPNDTAAVVFKDVAGQIVEMARHLQAERELS